MVVFYRNQNVKFVAEPALAPKDLNMDPKQVEEMNKQLKLAAEAPLPDDDEL